MTRIKSNMTITDCIVKLCEGNPGGLQAIMEGMKVYSDIDPDHILGEVAFLYLLDSYEIYGTDIYVIYNDKCQRDIGKMIMLLRATQVGIFSDDKLKELSKDQCRTINITDEEWHEIETKITKQITRFNRHERGTA